MTDDNPADSVVTSPTGTRVDPTQTPPRPSFKDEWRQKAEHVPTEIFYRALAFFCAAVLVSLLLFVLKDNHTVIAVRELIIADLTRQKFPPNPPASLVPKIDYLSVPEVGCQQQNEGDDSCEGTGRSDPAILASDVLAASASKVNILVIDAAPSIVTACDADTKHLLDGISQAIAGGKIVIMPRPLSTRNRPATQMRTYFDVCKTAYPRVMDAEQKVFYGTTTIEALPEIAVFSLMRNAMTVDMPGKTGEHGKYRETPSLAIIAARALTDKAQDVLRKSFDDAGLETSSFTTDGFLRADAKDGGHLTICNQNQKTSCEYQIDLGKMFRIKYGLDPKSKNHEVLRIVDPPSVGSTIPDQRTINVDINLVGADPRSSLDSHESVVGPITGGVNIANQIYAISNNLLLDEAPTWSTWLADFIVLLVASGVAGIFALVFIAAAFGFKLWFRRSGLQVSEGWIFWIWTGSALLTSCAAALWSWTQITDEFNSGVISFSIVGALLGFAKAVFLTESAAEKAIETLFKK